MTPEIKNSLVLDIHDSNPHIAWQAKCNMINRCFFFYFQDWSNSNFPCNLTRNITSHSMKNLAFHSLLRWKMITLPILTNITYTFLLERLGECTFWAWEWKGLFLHRPNYSSSFVHQHSKHLDNTRFGARGKESLHSRTAQPFLLQWEGEGAGGGGGGRGDSHMVEDVRFDPWGTKKGVVSTPKRYTKSNRIRNRKRAFCMEAPQCRKGSPVSRRFTPLPPEPLSSTAPTFKCYCLMFSTLSSTRTRDFDL